MQTVAETPTFTRQANKLFGEKERQELIELLAKSPRAGDEIPGTRACENCVSRLPGAVSAVVHG